MFLVVHHQHVLLDERGRSFSLVGNTYVHYVYASSAAFKESDRFYGTQTAGVVLKLYVVSVKLVPGASPSGVLHLIFP